MLYPIVLGLLHHLLCYFALVCLAHVDLCSWGNVSRILYDISPIEAQQSSLEQEIQVDHYTWNKSYYNVILGTVLTKQINYVSHSNQCIKDLGGYMCT